MQAGAGSVIRIEVRIQVGDHLMAASDDPLFLGLRGPEGREFRLRFEHKKNLRRGQLDHFVLGPPGAGATNVAQPELNDPTQPALHADQIAGFYLRKGFEPIPNVRAMGEMDDRVLVDWAEVQVVAEGRAQPLRFRREGPLWLGLNAGLSIEIPPAA